MTCPNMYLSLESVGTTCNNNHRVKVTFIVRLYDPPTPPEIGAQIHTRDFSPGIEVTIPVNYTDTEIGEWAINPNGQSVNRLYEYWYPAGTYSNIHLATNIPAEGCDPIPLSNEKYPVPGQITIPPCPHNDQPQCPGISEFEVLISDTCNENDQHLVSFSAIIESIIVGGHFECVAIETNTLIPVPNLLSEELADGTRQIKGELNLDPGSYEIVAKNNCTESTKTIEVLSCSPCPEVAIQSISTDPACVNGKRNVDIEILVSHVNGSQALLQARLSDEEQVLDTSEISQTGQVTLSASKAYSSGGHQLTVTILDPQDCQAITHDFVVGDCPCPEIILAPIFVSEPGECRRSDGARPVTITASVMLPLSMNGPVTAKLFVDDVLLDSQIVYPDFGQNPVEFEVEHYLPNGIHVITLQVSDGRCDYEQSSTPINITPCQTKPPWWPDIVPTVPDFICMAWFIFNIILLIATAFAIAVAACGWVIPPVGQISAGAAIALAILTFISIVLWVFACGWKRRVCAIARWLPRIIMLIGTIAAMIVLAIAIIIFLINIFVTGGVDGGSFSWPCFIGVVIEFAYYGILASIVREALMFVGCIPLNPWTFDDLEMSGLFGDG